VEVEADFASGALSELGSESVGVVLKRRFFVEGIDQEQRVACETKLMSCLLSFHAIGRAATSLYCLGGGAKSLSLAVVPNNKEVQAFRKCSRKILGWQLPGLPSWLRACNRRTSSSGEAEQWSRTR